MNGFIIKIFDTLPSTNTYLKENATLYDDKTVVIALSQTGGRGRLGKSFSSNDLGGLYMSILLKNCRVKSELTIRTAVCVHRAIKSAFGLDCSVKWVNDIYYDGKKLCGILCEQNGSGDIIAGIGVNVLKRQFPVEIQNIAASIGDYCKDADRERLLDNILSCFDDALSESFDDILAYYRSKCFILGKRVTVKSPSCEYAAVAQEILPDGSLLVKKDDGTKEALMSGEISLKLK